ncbi:MAG TPA: high-affinity nickel-transport family protein [Candidatus Binatia bacterium]|nr:high-affinity nickel-transport family protein [Candidatus Binatia bacterium]
MLTLLSIVFLGFFLGMRHATDPDHVIAVSTIVSRERSVAAAALIGVVWGIGHTMTILLVGGAIILFGIVIPPRMGLAMELSVALMLILLGMLNLTGIMQLITDPSAPDHPHRHDVHAHVHSHGDFVHTHRHGHAPAAHGHAEDATPLGWLDGTFRRLGAYQMIRPLVVGVVHGLAGSAAVALLVLAAIPTPAWGIVYLLVFGAGTIAGMMLVTAASSLPLAYTKARLSQVNHYLAVASGLLSLAFGLFLVYRIGFVYGLFTSAPRWIPE